MYLPTSSRPRPPQNRRTSSSSQLTKSTSIKFPSLLSDHDPNQTLTSTITQDDIPQSNSLPSIENSLATQSLNESRPTGVSEFTSNKLKISALGSNFPSMRSLSNVESYCDGGEEEDQVIQENDNPFSTYGGSRSRALSSSTRDSLAKSYGPSQSELIIPTLDRKTLDLKNKIQLVELVEKADKMITETERELDMAAKIGKSLFEENISLKAQLESQALESSQHHHQNLAELRERPSPSPFSSRHTRTISFPSTPSNPHQNTSWGSNLSTSPTTSLNRTLDRRHRLSSTTSIGSIQASPQKLSSGPNNVTSPEQLGTLSHENYTLILKVNEVEEEKLEAEREWKKKVRKLEKELLAMRSELERVGERNIVLEEEKTTINYPVFESVGKKPSQEDLNRTIRSHNYSTITPTLSRVALSPTTPSTPLSNLNTNLPFGKNYPSQSVRDPSLSQKRNPGSPGEDFLRPQSLFDAFLSPILPPSNSMIKDEKVDSLVVQLKLKIEELERTNEVFQEEQELLKMKLERAQKDAEESRRIYEELVESQDEPHLGWRDEPSLIGWRADESQSPTRNRNLDYTPTTSPESHRRPRKNRGGRHSFPRTLGSELGAQWDERSTSSCSSSFSTNSDYDSDDSTSAPTTFSQTQNFDVGRDSDSNTSFLNTSSNLFKKGALRFNGSPDNDEYEYLSQVIDDLPARWENEDVEIRHSSSTNNHRRRKSNTLDSSLKAIAWDPHSLSEDEDCELRRSIKGKGKGREMNEGSNYSVDKTKGEEGEIDFSRIGTGEWGERRKDTEGSIEYSPGALGNRRSHNLRNRRNQASSSANRREAALSRRDMALERLGLESPHDTITLGYESLDRREEEDEEEEEEEEMSEFEYVDGERVQKGSYWPMTFRAKYAPRMIGLRITDKAISTVVMVINYLRLFIILAFAVFFAIYQGPKRTLGLIDPKRRLQ